MSLLTFLKRIGDHAVLFRLRRRPFMLTLSLQPIVPAGFLPDWIGAHAVLPLPDIFWEPKYRKWSRLINFFIFFAPLFPLLVLVPVLVFFRFPKRGTSVKMIRLSTNSPRGKSDFDLWQFHEILQGKMILILDSFAKFSKGKWVWQVHEIPQRKKILTVSRNSLWKISKENRNNLDPTHGTMDEEKMKT